MSNDPSQSPDNRKFIPTRTTADIWERLKPYAREMRQTPTSAEDALWQRLRRKQVMDVKFRRQQPIDRFIVDFYSAKLRLVIEVDGSVHDEPDQQDYDELRQAYLESMGLRVLRFRNEEVLRELDAVLERIGEVLLELGAD